MTICVCKKKNNDDDDDKRKNQSLFFYFHRTKKQMRINEWVKWMNECMYEKLLRVFRIFSNKNNMKKVIIIIKVQKYNIGLLIAYWVNAIAARLQRLRQARALLALPFEASLLSSILDFPIRSLLSLFLFSNHQ